MLDYHIWDRFLKWFFPAYRGPRFSGPLVALLVTQETILQTILSAHDQNLVKGHVNLMCKIMIKSGHKSAQAKTAQLSWHKQICGLPV